MIPKGVSSFVDRHGKVRWRFRKNGRTISLNCAPDEKTFDEAMAAALSGVAPAKHKVQTEIRQRVLVEIFALEAFKRARTRATTKKLPFDLSLNDLEMIMQQQNYKCAVSGIDFPHHRRDADRTKDAFRPSLDRIQPKDGYVIGNVRFVCEIVNLAMNNWGTDPLFKLAEALQKMRNGKPHGKPF